MCVARHVTADRRSCRFINLQLARLADFRISDADDTYSVTIFNVHNILLLIVFIFWHKRLTVHAEDHESCGVCLKGRTRLGETNKKTPVTFKTISHKQNSSARLPLVVSAAGSGRVFWPRPSGQRRYRCAVGTLGFLSALVRNGWHAWRRLESRPDGGSHASSCRSSSASSRLHPGILTAQFTAACRRTTSCLGWREICDRCWRL